MSFLGELIEGVVGGIISGVGSEDMGCDWYCDDCHAHMNTQTGFTTADGSWTCIECGSLNDVSVGNIRHYGERQVTEEQLRYIRKIEELLDVSFYGVTLEEASDFIDEHRDRYQAKLHTPYKYR
jgi:hypothetical protein